MLVAGVDLGGTAVNYTLLNDREEFLIAGLCEHPARSTEGPSICLKQIADGLKVAVEKAGISLADVAVVGLDTPGPASARTERSMPAPSIDASRNSPKSESRATT